MPVFPPAFGGARAAPPRLFGPPAWHARLRLYSGALLAMQAFVVAYWGWLHLTGATPGPRIAWDFGVYWSASGLALAHGPAAAYDWNLLRAAEAGVLPEGSFGPFAYPPTFLLAIYPLHLLPFWVALAVFWALGVGAYLLLVRRMAGSAGLPWELPALAFPGMWVVLISGQNSLFTMAAVAGALVLLERRPLAAGACIALLCVKPQLGVLFPLFLLCRRQWVALAGATVATAAYAGITWLALGTGTFVAALRSITMFRHAVAEQATQVLTGAPTVFAMARVAGWTVPHAYLAQAALAVPVVVACLWLWSTGARAALAGAALVTGTLLVQPYLLYYDLAWLAIPLVLLAVDFAARGCTRWEAAVLVATWLMPMQALLVLPVPAMGHWTPAVLAILLAVVVRRHAAGRR